ncbi:sORF3 [Sparus aurata papillomavirus 1]|uniref:SORF3 n=1 Tax=Sparus aurata papillomavirus 1 TaxID=1885928 RepID=A0A1B2RWA6_9PAPI|nr:sORF3 [Sparus aurata papillomavirus 1]AOC55277.1 sORF3 [Sparus aurata papillomavirus 1]
MLMDSILWLTRRKYITTSSSLTMETFIMIVLPLHPQSLPLKRAKRRRRRRLRKLKAPKRAQKL